MIGWMDGEQIWIALESSSGVSSKDVLAISVSHLIWKEEICFSKMKYQNQNGRQYGILLKRLQFIFHPGNVHKSPKTDA
jgi:hypothetical protein